MRKLGEIELAVVGLGYVGLPLAVEFGRKRNVIGFDINPQRISELAGGSDHTLEVETDELLSAQYLSFTSKSEDLKRANCFIVTVPTPVDDANQPDFGPLISASRTVGQVLKTGDIVIYESTVYPGATEEICVPVLEAASGLKFNEGFFVGYSPERINPGDKSHRLVNITKVTSGSTEATAGLVDQLYASIIEAGTHKAPSIKVAEAAKVIENTQRDLNIALMNELSLIFGRLGIDTVDVLKAAGTKWNFLPFRPGLVGGHCIGVDPYYLTHKAESIGYHPQVILAGRRINDGMASYVAHQTVKKIIDQGLPVKGAKVLVLGLTFKEDCPDIRNSKVADLIGALQEFGCDVKTHDPMAKKEHAMYEYGVEVLDWSEVPRDNDAIVAAVAHKDYLSMPVSDLVGYLKPNGVFVDVKAAFDSAAISAKGVELWRM